MSHTVTWHGTPVEQKRLLAAVDSHCTCDTNDKGQKIGLCQMHIYMLKQDAVDRLLYSMRMRGRYIAEEYGC
jgi:hypothetical protein